MMRTFGQHNYPIALIVLSVAISAQVGTGKRSVVSSAPESKMVDAAQLLRDVQVLAADDMEGRSADRASIQKTRDYVEKRFVESGLQPSRQEFEMERRGAAGVLRGVNFIGQIKGRKDVDKYIVITAHYDHEGIKDGKIYNGADDNASGTAALFALASYFKRNQPAHSLVFVAFDAEERGLLGAQHFVSNLPVKKESILLNINIDMISRSDKGELYAVGTYHYPQLKPALEAVQKKSKIKLRYGHDRPELGRDDWTFQSDHAAFHRAGIPFVYFGVENHKDYHRPTDDFANIHAEFYVRAVETIIEAIRSFDAGTSK